MKTTLYLDEEDIKDFKKKLKKLGKYKKDVLSIMFCNYAMMKNSARKWYEVEINIKEYEEDIYKEEGAA